MKCCNGLRIIRTCCGAGGRLCLVLATASGSQECGRCCTKGLPENVTFGVIPVVVEGLAVDVLQLEMDVKSSVLHIVGRSSSVGDMCARSIGPVAGGDTIPGGNMSCRLATAVSFVILIMSTTVSAQVDPYEYQAFSKELSKRSPGDPLYERYRGYVRSAEQKLSVFFRDMPAVNAKALLGNGRPTLPGQWQTKLQLELRRSGIELSKEFDTNLMLQASRQSSGQWRASLKVTEYVTLQRPNKTTLLPCVTYEANRPFRNTEEEAVSDMWDALNEFCLLHLKYGKP